MQEQSRKIKSDRTIVKPPCQAYEIFAPCVLSDIEIFVS